MNRDAFGRPIGDNDGREDGRDAEGHDGRGDPTGSGEGAASDDRSRVDELLRLFGGTPFDEDDDAFSDDDEDWEVFGDGSEQLGLDPRRSRDADDPTIADADEDFDAELSEREAEERLAALSTDWAAEAETVVDELLARAGEAQPEPRLDATRRAAELLGDVHMAWSMIHITGTNGKSSTARIAESLVRAQGLRTGLLTSPHLVDLTERICIDGSPISDERFVTNWRDIEPIIGLVDAELRAAGKPALTFFEALTVLAYACFTDAPIDVAIIEVGMGGEWDSTNVADADVAVFTPIALDHVARLGSSIAEIARTKAGIIKPDCRVVTSVQPPEALAEIERAATLTESELFVEDADFGVIADAPAVGGRLVELRGLFGEHEPVGLRLHGEYQAHNAALAVAAVEALFGEALRDEVLTEGLGAAVSPGRLDLVGTDPTVILDAAHNPHGAEHLAAAMRSTFAFDELVLVLGILEDKDVDGVIRPLAEIATRIIVTESDSPRAIPAWDLGERVREVLGEETASAKRVEVIDRWQDAIDLARQDAVALAARTDGPVSSGVLVTGSITLIGDVAGLARREGWREGPSSAAPLEVGPGSVEDAAKAIGLDPRALPASDGLGVDDSAASEEDD